VRNKWFTRFAAWIIFVGVSSSAFPARAQTVACQVAIDSGVVAGVQVGQSCVYKGIPYAASPAGAGRWRPPAPVVPWSGVRSATTFGNICPQLQGTTAVGKEDCLNLNIFAPNGAAALPVIFFIHGGGNRAASNRAEGGTSLDGQYLAEHGPAVVVVINFRLGALGWLAHPSLDAESAAAGGTGTSGNYGLLDQIAALHWVQRNIAAFGGDPSRVMITGHSSGALDVGTLLVSPLAHGLFSAALIDGGGFANFDTPTLASYEATLETYVVESLGCANVADVPACLRALPSATIVKTAPGLISLRPPTYRPIIDGVVLTENPLQTAKEGAQNRVPLVIGGVDRESALPVFIPFNADPDDTAYKADVYAFWGQTLGDQVLALYPSSNYPTPRDAFIAATTDYRWLCPDRRLARAISNSQKEPVYRFVFTHAQSGPPVATAQGAWHGEELMFIFRSFMSGVFGPFTPTVDELTLSDQMIGYWTRFAATGDPNGGAAPLPWFVYGQNADNQGQNHIFFVTDAQGDAKREPFLQLETPIAEGAGFHFDVCENFWDVLVGDTNNGHGEGSFTGDNNENAGNETFITDADFDNDDQPLPPKD
jgi:para-nitrobenzyl esterase